LGELFDAPVLQHAVVQPVLVDGGKLVGERLVEVIDDLRVALHDASPVWPYHGPAGRAGQGPKAAETAEILGFANETQKPASGCEQVSTAGAVAHFSDQLVGFFEALATLRRFAELLVNRLGIARQRASGVAQFGFANGIAHADVHGFVESPKSARGLLRMACSSKELSETAVVPLPSEWQARYFSERSDGQPWVTRQSWPERLSERHAASAAARVGKPPARSLGTRPARTISRSLPASSARLRALLHS